MLRHEPGEGFHTELSLLTDPVRVAALLERECPQVMGDFDDHLDRVPTLCTLAASFSRFTRSRHEVEGR